MWLKNFSASDLAWLVARILAAPLVVALVTVWLAVLVALAMRDTLRDMNPLGQLPASNSQQFSLDQLDLQKLGRSAIIFGAAWLVSAIGAAAGLHYTFHGQDVTGAVVILLGIAGDALRRFLAGQKAS